MSSGLALSRDIVRRISEAAAAGPSLEPQLLLYTDLDCIEWCASDQKSHLRQMLAACKSSFLGLRRNPYLGLAAIDLEHQPA
jgi:hypothetical protein